MCSCMCLSSTAHEAVAGLTFSCTGFSRLEVQLQYLTHAVLHCLICVMRGYQRM